MYTLKYTLKGETVEAVSLSHVPPTNDNAKGRTVDIKSTFQKYNYEVIKLWIVRSMLTQPH